jgi:hypothetical protein
MSDIMANPAQPINYSGLMVPSDPVGAFMKSQNLQANTNLLGQQAAQAGAGANLENAQAGLAGAQTNSAAYALQRQQQYIPMLNQVLQNPTPQNFAALTAAFPDNHAALSASYDMNQTGQKQAVIQPVAQAYSALLNNRPDLATNIVQEQRDALVNSTQDTSDPAYQQKLTHFDTLLQTIQTNPKAAQGLMGATLSSVLTPAEFSTAFPQYMGLPATVGKASAEATTAGATAAVAPAAAAADVAQKQAGVANTLNEMQQRVANFGLDQQKFQADTSIKMAQLRYQTQFPNLPAEAQSGIADAVGQAQSAQMSADRAEGIAGRIQADPNYGSGISGKANAAVQDFFGNQDESNNLRKEYTQMRSSAVFSQIQNGRTTDNDLKVINGGFPDASANPQQISTFLTSYANVQRRMAVYQDAKSDWLSNVGSMGKAPHDVSIQGVMVPQNTTFNDYMKRGAPNAVPAVTPPSAGPGQDVPAYMKYGQ